MRVCRKRSWVEGQERSRAWRRGGNRTGNMQRGQEHRSGMPRETTSGRQWSLSYNSFPRADLSWFAWDSRPNRNPQTCARRKLEKKAGGYAALLDEALTEIRLSQDGIYSQPITRFCVALPPSRLASPQLSVWGKTLLGHRNEIQT